MARPPALRVSPDRQVTASDIDCLKEAFALFDCDRDGEITVEELGKVSGASVISSSSYHPFQGFWPKLGFIFFGSWQRKTLESPSRASSFENIIKGTSDPGIDSFDHINNMHDI